ncbi:hypothetical protein BC829DRAFT_387394, partial [Chytridium lagenaria]
MIFTKSHLLIALLSIISTLLPQQPPTPPLSLSSIPPPTHLKMTSSLPPRHISRSLIDKEPFMTHMESMELMRLVPGPKPKKFVEKKMLEGLEHVHVHYYVKGEKARQVLKRLRGVGKLFGNERLAKVYEMATGKKKGKCLDVCSGVDYRACADCSYRHLSYQLENQSLFHAKKKSRRRRRKRGKGSKLAMKAPPFAVDEMQDLNEFHADLVDVG